MACHAGWLRNPTVQLELAVRGEVIDSEYRGPVQCLLYNSTKTACRITKGEQIFQTLFLHVPEVEWIHGQLPTIQQNEGGFGSTD